jgi:DNA gyrase subunit B
VTLDGAVDEPVAESPEEGTDEAAAAIQDEALAKLGAVRSPPFDSAPDTPRLAQGATRPNARVADVTVGDSDELVEFFLAAGKKGVAINRYKGLGEMNPDQLWATTMNPDARTLLQVKAEDHTEADQMFTTLMGDQVEPRRKFIEDNALDVKNLDI